MGFTKRYFSKDLILKNIDSGFPLSKLFNVDAFIFNDSESQTAFRIHKNGYSDEEVKQFLLTGVNPLIEKK